MAVVLVAAAAGTVSAYDKSEGEAFHDAYWRCERLAKAKDDPKRFSAARACVFPLIDQAKKKKTKAELAYRACEWLEKAADEDVVKLGEARAAFLQVGVTYVGEEMAARARFRAARLLEDALGDPARADAEYRAIIRDAPNAIAALNALVHVEQALPSNDARVQLYERELTARPHTALAPVLLTRMGHAALASPQLAARAVKVFDVLSRQDSAKSDDALYFGAKARVMTGDYPGAIAALEKLCATKETTPIPKQLLPGDLHSSRMDDARFLLGEIMRDSLGDDRRAEHHFRLLVEESPASRLVDDALQAVAAMHLVRGDRKAAAGVYKELLKLRPNSRFKKAAAELGVL